MQLDFRPFFAFILLVILLTVGIVSTSSNVNAATTWNITTDGNEDVSVKGRIANFTFFHNSGTEDATVSIHFDLVSGEELVASDLAKSAYVHQTLKKVNRVHKFCFDTCEVTLSPGDYIYATYTGRATGEGVVSYTFTLLENGNPILVEARNFTVLPK